MLLLEVHQAIECLDFVPFGQHQLRAVVEPQVPTPLTDTYRGNHPLLQFGAIGQRIDQRRGGNRRAGTNHQRKLMEFSEVLVGHQLAIAIDQREPALVLPDRKRPPLFQKDDDGSGQTPLDSGLIDP
jgi:hypothetical protein